MRKGCRKRQGDVGTKIALVVLTVNVLLILRHSQNVLRTYLSSQKTEGEVFHEKLSKHQLSEIHTSFLSTPSPFGNYTTELFTVWTTEKLPSDRCFPSPPHALVWQRHHAARAVFESAYEPYRNGTEPASVCRGPQFTSIRRNATDESVWVALDCPSGLGKWDRMRKNVMNESGSFDWPNLKKEEVVPRPVMASPGVDWIYTSCKNSTEEERHTNVRIQPYRVKNLKTTPEKAPERPSVLLLIIDSVSHAAIDRDLQKVKQVLNDFEEFTYVFKHTSMVGVNSPPNVEAMMEGPNLPKVARSLDIVTSAFEDYCPDVAVCTHYPYKEHSLCGWGGWETNLLCNYKSNIIDLYYSNPRPGCREGQFWINNHLNYARDLWNVYQNERKFHISLTYGCHMERMNRYTCNSNDIALARFLRSFVPQNPDTAVIVASDHGFHWANQRGAFNDHITGEFEHRNPFLAMFVPWKKRDPTLKNNTQRFVTHRDLHATLLGLLAGNNRNIHQQGHTGFDLIRQQLPEKRSCNDANIPEIWCNCFRPRVTKADPPLDAHKGMLS